ncbi:MAG: hypothetical protein ACOVQ4_18240 [Flectobacillus sp.]|uniref:hypothetical protein n=1 Tax=Flectobacillus sp. TaxID=50419 RepID=UPI003B9A0C02
MHHLLIASLLSVGQPTAQLSDITISQTISVHADSLSFKDYFGNYIMQANDQIPKIKIYYKNGSLVALAGDYPETKLTKKQDDEFEEANYGAAVFFIRKDGNVVGIKVVVQGQEMLGDKEM